MAARWWTSPRIVAAPPVAAPERHEPTNRAEDEATALLSSARPPMSIPVSAAALAGICFDAFGTLFDLRPLIDEIDAKAGPGAGSSFVHCMVSWTWHATAAEQYPQLDEIALTALAAATRERGVRLENGDAHQLVSRLLQLPLADGAAETLRILQPAQLALLSNGSQDALKALVHNAGVAQLFRHLLSTDQVRRFKPAPQVYALAPVAFGVSSDRVLMVSANDWDVAGAGMAGLRTAWVSRGRPQTFVLGVQPDIVVESLADLPDILADRGLLDFEPSGATVPGRPLPPGSDYWGQDKISADSFPASDPPAW
jgi:2-haloacid dehalogenase